VSDSAGERCPYPHDSRPADAEASGCPVPHGAAPRWHEAALRHADERAEQSAPFSHIDAQRAVDMAHAVAETRAGTQRVEEITELFVRTLGKKLGHGHPLSERTGIAGFTWTAEAEERLAEVPEFCRELTRWRVEWTAYKLGLGTTITPDVMQVKYDLWGRVSHRIQERHDAGLPWTDDALLRFERVPDFVKGQVLEAVEGNARRLGAEKVDSETVDRVVEKWKTTGDFHEGLYGFK
jgi:Proto-chlorophyllide reductase 57 kD subunit